MSKAALLALLEQIIEQSVRDGRRITVPHREAFARDVAELCEEFEIEETPEGRVFSGMWEGGFEWSILLAAKVE